MQKSATESDEKHEFSDQSDISDWAAKAVNDMYFSDIMLGAEDNLFQPNHPYTREQAAITVTRLLDFCTRPDKTENTAAKDEPKESDAAN